MGRVQLAEQLQRRLIAAVLVVARDQQERGRRISGEVLRQLATGRPAAAGEDDPREPGRAETRKP
jgi:hypothetical protein